MERLMSPAAYPRPPLPPGPYLVVGLARSGVAAALALRAARPDERIVACDSGSPAEALVEAERLAQAGVEVHLDTNGIHLLEASPPPATLVKSPGVPWDARVVGQARLRDIEVIGELELGWRLVPNQFIAVTGTNGKTTTVELIGAIHRVAGESVAVAGNVGTPVSSLVGRLDPAATVVCEASSFQLEDASAFAPEAAVFLNFSEDHLDRHEATSTYFAAKTRIFANQRLADLAVVNGDDEYLSHPLTKPDLDARTVTFGVRPSNDVRLQDGWIVWNDQPVIDSHEVRLRGVPNLYNAMAAAAVCLERGIDGDSVRSGLRDFTGLPHRLEHVTEIAGVEYINDSKATNPGAAGAAMETLGGGIHVILGGSLKGDTYFEALEPPISMSCRAVYLIGEATEEIAQALVDTEVEILRCGDLERAVTEASRRARPGEKVLLSPACASFDQYRDYEERGEHFKELVRMLAVERG
jgi:UDP-N-acetylmuramoylalanine--D-glutamate ligase